MPRMARLVAVNYPHHITQRGNNRDAVFFQDQDRQFYLQTLKKYSYLWKLEVWAYCLMPNHVHVLGVPRKPESLAKGMGSTNLIYTQYINRRYARSGRLWQNRFFSNIIEKESYLWAAVRYIERNPVRAGLVASPEDYPWSSAAAHLLGAQDKVLSGEVWLDELDVQAYREFLQTENEPAETAIRKAAMTDRPLGSETFVKGLVIMLGRDLVPKKRGRPRKI